MMIKRKTTEKFGSFNAHLRVYADDEAMTGHGGTANPAAAMHRFGIGDGELRKSEEDNAKYGDQIVPELTIVVPGFGELIVSPGEVHRLLVMIEQIQTTSRHPGPYVGRENTVKATVYPSTAVVKLTV
jgi:hypothetical protein